MRHVSACLPSACLSYRAQALLQLLNAFQSSSFCLSILQQRPNVKYIVKVGLNLNLQPVTLCVLQSLRTDSERDKLMKSQAG